MTFSRPRNKYQPKSVLANQTRMLDPTLRKEPVTAEEFDANYNYIIDCLNLLQDLITALAVGTVPGSDQPENKDMVCYTDGVGPKWKFLTGVNFDVGVVSARELADNSVITSKLNNLSVTGAKVAKKSITIDKLITGNGTSPVIPWGSRLNGTYSELAINPYEIPTRATNTFSISSQPISYIWNRSLDNLCNGTKIADRTINVAKLDEFTQNGLCFIGCIMPSGISIATEPPRGWLDCDGKQYKKTDYPYLYNVIQDAWNGDIVAEGYFCVPDFRGKSPYGLGTDGNANNLITETDNGDFLYGSTFGAEKTIIDITNMPSHNHDIHVWNGENKLGSEHWYKGSGGATHYFPIAAKDRWGIDEVRSNPGGTYSRPMKTVSPGVFARFFIRAY